MAEITAEMVKRLREETNQSMMECKKALTEAKGDFEQAKELLRKKGLADAGKKAARVTKEGRVAISATATAAAMVEVVCETDFCARNDEFNAMVKKVAALAAASPAGAIENNPQIEAAVQDCFRKIGENMRYSRGVKIEAQHVGTYIHHNNKVGVLIGYEGELSPEVVADICMHIAFHNPLALRTDEVPADLVAKERKFIQEEAAASGKPESIQQKMVDGKVNKFLAANALLEQPFVKDDKKKVKEVVGAATLVRFACFKIE